MNRIWKGAALLFAALMLLTAVGCTQKDTGPKFEKAYIIDEYATLVGETQCLVDGDPTSDAVARIEIKSSAARNTDAVYTELKAEYGLGVPALCDEYNSCIVFTADKRPVIKVMDWEKVYYVIPAQSEEDARHLLEVFMRAYAQSQGIDEK